MSSWRFGFGVRERVRDHVGQGYGKISQCFCTSVFCNAETPCPRASCEVRVFECELSTYLARRIRQTSSWGTGGDLATRLTSPVMFITKAPTFLLPTGPVERKLFFGPNVGFHTLATHRWFRDFGETQASVYAQRALPGRGR